MILFYNCLVRNSYFYKLEVNIIEHHRKQKVHKICGSPPEGGRGQLLLRLIHCLPILCCVHLSAKSNQIGATHSDMVFHPKSYSAVRYIIGVASCKYLFDIMSRSHRHGIACILPRMRSHAICLYTP